MGRRHDDHTRRRRYEPQVQSADATRAGRIREAIDELVTRGRDLGGLRERLVTLGHTMTLGPSDHDGVLASLSRHIGAHDALVVMGRSPSEELTRADSQRKEDAALLAHDGSGLDYLASMRRDTIADEAKEALPAPIKDEVERTTGQPAGSIDLYTGPVASRLVDTLGGEGASIGKTVFVPARHRDTSREESKGLMVHEATHALQSRQLTGPMPKVPRHDRASGMEHQATRAGLGEQTRITTGADVAFRSGTRKKKKRINSGSYSNWVVAEIRSGTWLVQKPSGTSGRYVPVLDHVGKRILGQYELFYLPGIDRQRNEYLVLLVRRGDYVHDAQTFGSTHTTKLFYYWRAEHGWSKKQFQYMLRFQPKDGDLASIFNVTTAVNRPWGYVFLIFPKETAKKLKELATACIRNYKKRAKRKGGKQSKSPLPVSQGKYKKHIQAIDQLDKQRKKHQAQLSKKDQNKQKKQEASKKGQLQKGLKQGRIHIGVSTGSDTPGKHLYHERLEYLRENLQKLYALCKSDKKSSEFKSDKSHLLDEMGWVFDHMDDWPSKGVGVSTRHTYGMLKRMRRGLYYTSSKRKALTTTKTMFKYFNVYLKNLHIILKQAWLKGKFDVLALKDGLKQMKQHVPTANDLEAGLLKAILMRVLQYKRPSRGYITCFGYFVHLHGLLSKEEPTSATGKATYRKALSRATLHLSQVFSDAELKAFVISRIGKKKMRAHKKKLEDDSDTWDKLMGKAETTPVARRQYATLVYHFARDLGRAYMDKSMDAISSHITKLEKLGKKFEGGSSGMKPLKAYYYPITAAMDHLKTSDVPRVAPVPLQIYYGRKKGAGNKPIHLLMDATNSAVGKGGRFSPRYLKYNLNQLFPAFVEELSEKYATGRIIIENLVGVTDGSRRYWNKHVKRIQSDTKKEMAITEGLLYVPTRMPRIKNALKQAGMTVLSLGTAFLATVFPPLAIPLFVISVANTADKWLVQSAEGEFKLDKDKVKDVLALISEGISLGKGLKAARAARSTQFLPPKAVKVIGDVGTTLTQAPAKGAYMAFALKAAGAAPGAAQKIIMGYEIYKKFEEIEKSKLPEHEKAKLRSALIVQGIKSGALWAVGKIVGGAADKVNQRRTVGGQTKPKRVSSGDASDGFQAQRAQQLTESRRYQSSLTKWFVGVTTARRKFERRGRGWQKRFKATIDLSKVPSPPTFKGDYHQAPAGMRALYDKDFFQWALKLKLVGISRRDIINARVQGGRIPIPSKCATLVD